MEVRHYMNSSPITLREEDSLGKAVQAFIDNKIDGIPVVNENGKLAGIITHSRAFRLLSELTDQSTPLKQVMKADVIAIGPDEDVAELIKLPVSFLPVVDEGELIGVYNLSDTIHAYYNSTQSLQQELNEIINGLHNGVLTINDAGCILLINPAAEYLLDIKNGSILGKNIQEIFPEANLQEVLQTRTPIINKKIIRGDRSFLVTCTVVFHNARDMALGIAIINDFTELERVYVELLKTKELTKELETIIETSSDGMLITDKDGTILRVNAALAQIFGSPVEAIIGSTISSYSTMFAKNPRKGVKELLQTAKREATVAYPRLPDGRRLMVAANPIIGEGGAVSGFVIDIRDISLLLELEEKVDDLQQLYNYEVKKRTASEGHVFADAKSKRLLESTMRIAKVDSTVLITGESGVGKEVIAQLLYTAGERADKPFVKISCSAIPEQLLESELFGYEPGAFTGADKHGKRGLFEIANNGTLFLDEIGELPLALQAKLLRALQEQEIIRVGGVRPRKINVRIIAATNRDLSDMVAKKTFRLDLFYRLNVVPIHVPPLRERKDDIPVFLQFFLDKYNRKFKRSKSVSTPVIQKMLAYDWPGNIRELENFVERSIVTSAGENIEWVDITPPRARDTQQTDDGPRLFNGNYRELVADYERGLLQRALAQFGSTRKMAVALGLDQSTIVKKISKLGIRRNDI